MLGTLCIVLFLVAWQVASDKGWVDKLFVSSPIDVGKQLWVYVRTANFRSDLATSGSAFFEGLALSIGVGLVVGAAMGWFKRVGYFLDYFVSIVYSAPRIALVPLLILWYGIGHKTGVAMVFLMAVFPILINTMSGVRNVDPTLLEMARSQKASHLQILRTVVLPASLPEVISGVRLAIGNGLIGFVVAEFLAGRDSGLGFRMQESAQEFDAPQLFAGLVVIAVFGLALTQLLQYAERHLQRWRTS
jgi:NitT/TauT family transport system permease protein